MKHALLGATKQHTPTSSLSWLTSICQKWRPVISKQPAFFKKIVSILLTILVTQELWALGILCLLASIVDNRVPISYDYGGRTRLVACTRRIFASDTSTPTALGR